MDLLIFYLPARLAFGLEMESELYLFLLSIVPLLRAWEG
jgi:hypothetical protein